MVNGAPVVRPLKTPRRQVRRIALLTRRRAAFAAFAAAEESFEGVSSSSESRRYSVEGHADPLRRATLRIWKF